MIQLDEYEAEAVHDAIDAITTGMSWIASGVDWDGTLPAAEEAAMDRLQKLLNAVVDSYPAAWDDWVDKLTNERR